MHNSRDAMSPQFKDEAHQMAIPREDGDSIRFWIRAWDVLNNSAADSMLLHVDSSPPENHTFEYWVKKYSIELNKHCTILVLVLVCLKITAV